MLNKKIVNPINSLLDHSGIDDVIHAKSTIILL